MTDLALLDIRPDHSTLVDVPADRVATVTVITGALWYSNLGPGVTAANSQGQLLPGQPMTFTIPTWVGSGADCTIQVLSVPVTGSPSFTPVPQVISKGDLLVTNSMPALVRLPVGADTQVLIADSTQPAGVKWAAMTGPTGPTGATGAGGAAGATGAPGPPGAGAVPVTPVPIVLTGFSTVAGYSAPVSLTYPTGMVFWAGRVQATTTIATATVITSASLPAPPASTKLVPVLFQNAAGTTTRIDTLKISTAGVVTYYGGGLVSGDTLAFDDISYNNLTLLPASSYDSAVLADNPVMFLPLSETSGTVAADSTGNGHAGTYTGGFTLNSGGPCNDGEGAVVFDGSSGYVTVPTAAALNLTLPYSIEAWIKPTDATQVNLILSKNVTAVNDGYLMQTNQTSPHLRAQRADGTVGATLTESIMPVTVGVWTHVVVTDDGVNLTIYLNNQATAAPSLGAMVANTTPVLVGHRAPGGEWFKGSVAKVAVYSTALTSAQVAAHYAARSIPPAALTSYVYAPVAYPTRFSSPNSFWYKPLPANATRRADEAATITELQRQITATYPIINTNRYALAIVTANADTPRYRVALPAGVSTYKLQAAMNSVPVPLGAVSSPGTDGSLSIWDPTNDTYYEFWIWDNTATPGNYNARWGGVVYEVSKQMGAYPLTPSYVRAETWGGSASGLLTNSGVLTWNEWKTTGQFAHALGAASYGANSNFIYPAWRGDGYSSGPPWNGIPHGTVMRFDPSLNIDALGFYPFAKAVAKAIQTYGVVFHDGSGTFNLYAEDITEQGPYTAAWWNSDGFAGGSADPNAGDTHAIMMQVFSPYMLSKLWVIDPSAIPGP